MRNKLLKKYQHSLNKKIKLLNKNIAEDNLWKGRFEFRQKKVIFEIFQDGSGALLHVVIRAYDKETGFHKDFWIEYAPWLSFTDWAIYELVNKFIVEDSGVWREAKRPTPEFSKDYTKIHIPKEVMRKGYNFYFSKNWR